MMRRATATAWFHGMRALSGSGVVAPVTATPSSSACTATRREASSVTGTSVAALLMAPLWKQSGDDGGLRAGRAPDRDGQRLTESDVVEQRRRRSPWYRTKDTPSTANMLVTARRVLIAGRFSPTRYRDPSPSEIDAVTHAWALAAA